MIGFFLIIFVIFIALIFIGVIVFFALVVFGFNKAGYNKTAKYLAISVVSIILFGAFFLIIILFKENRASKVELLQSLSHTKIVLQDDFEIVKQKDDWDLTYNKQTFILKISDKDFFYLKNQHPNMVIRDSIFHKKPALYDTLKVKIDDQKQLFYYRATHNLDN